MFKKKRIYYYNNLKLKLLAFLRDKKKLSKLLVVIIIIYSIFASIVVYYTSEVFFDTVESISVPNGYFSVNLSTTDPELGISFGVSNTGLYDLSDLYLNISLDIEYYKETKQEGFFILKLWFLQ